MRLAQSLLALHDQRGLDGAHGWRDLLLFISFHFISFYFILLDHSLPRRYLDILIPALQSVLMDPVPEARGLAAKAIGTAASPIAKWERCKWERAERERDATRCSLQA